MNSSFRQAAIPLISMAYLCFPTSSSCAAEPAMGERRELTLLWVEENGDLLFYLGRNDTFSEGSQLCKAGRIRVALSPNPFLVGAPFRQELKLLDGVCGITARAPGMEVRLRVWVDSAAPVVNLLGESGQPQRTTVKVESWRTEPQAVPDESAWTLAKSPHKIIQSADVFPKAGKNFINWYHRNENSFAFEETVRVQLLESIRGTLKDPLLHRTLGGWVTGVGFEATDDRTLTTSDPVRKFYLRVASPSEQTPTAAGWLKIAKSHAAAAVDATAALARNAASWQAFWERSWVPVWAAWDRLFITHRFRNHYRTYSVASALQKQLQFL